MAELDEKTASILRDYLDESRWYPEDPEYPGEPEIDPETMWRALRNYYDDKLNEAMGGDRRHDPVAALEALALARLLSEDLREQFWGLVYDARKDGDSWDQIGAALGCSRQSAHEMYAKDLEKRGEWWKGRCGAEHFARNLPEYKSVMEAGTA